MTHSISLYKSEYMTIVYHEELSILECIWSQLSVEMTSQILQREMTARWKYIDQFRPLNILVDAKYFYYKIPPDMQTWIYTNFRSKYTDEGVYKLAFIISVDVVAQISIEQSIQEDRDPKFQIQYFDDRDNAIKWFK